MRRNGGDFKALDFARRIGKSIEYRRISRRNSRGALSTEIPGRLAPLENRLAAVRVVRSAILEAGRAERNKTESISSRFSSLSRGTRGHSRRIHRCFPVFEIRHVGGKTERGIIKVFESDKCVSKGGVVGEVLEMSATAGLPSSSKQPDNYGEP